MALFVSIVQRCFKGFRDQKASGRLSLEAEGGYMNSLGRNMRFNTFRCSNVWKLCSRSKHKAAKNLLREVIGHVSASTQDRSFMLDKVSLLMGYRNVQDLIENDICRESNTNFEEMIGEFDSSVDCQRFQSIILGNSALVELYDEQMERVDLVGNSCEVHLPGTVGENWNFSDKISETWQVSDATLPRATSTSSEEDNHDFLLSDSPSMRYGVGEKSNLMGNKDEPAIKAATRKKEEPDIKANITSPKLPVSPELVLDTPIKFVSGISKRHQRQLDESGFYTLRKLLHYFPRTYVELRHAQGPISDGHHLIFTGKVLSSRGIRASSSLSFLKVVVECDVMEEGETSEIKKIYLHLKKFFRGTRFTYVPFLKSLESKHKVGDRVYVSGKAREMPTKDHYEMKEYTIDNLQEEEESNLQGKARPCPVYPAKGGWRPSFFGDNIMRALKGLSANIDPIPDIIRLEFALPNLLDAYWGIHHPSDLNEADLARKRLIFDEFFYLQLGRLFQMLDALGSPSEKDGLLEKYRNHELNSIPVEKWSGLTTKLLQSLPFPLTPGQLNATSEIIWDLKRPIPMNRLLQGDVGCGKTVVAFLACMEVIDAGFQAAFMVPTELLAAQQYQQIVSLLDKFGGDCHKPSIALLTGSTSSKQSQLVRKGLQSGEISLVIGTQSLISESVDFAALRIAVVDEQHRFGVIQRARFSSKLYSVSLGLKASSASVNESSDDRNYMAPHVLALSATPIPRTLALALYGDMSLTQITDLPPGRIPVETFALEGNEVGFEKMYETMHNELQAGGKIYLVYPIIDESEQLPLLHAATAEFSSIAAKFKDYQCGLLHGRLKGEEKDEALQKFRCGETQILLSTQVIEIGVDVPDASMMVVMNAERMGIAQLHQLRGRVGRGTRKSKCIFLAATAGALHRLRVLEKSSDGFYLANVDLLHRGPGNLLGKEQSGHLPDFPIARLEIDGNILQKAHHAALKVLTMSSDLERFPRLKAELSMRQPLCLLGD